MNISKLLLCLILVVVVCVLHLCSVESTIDIFDRYGRKVDSFSDREATLDDEEFMPMEGYIVAADPQDACGQISSPTFLTNFTFGKFVLVNGSENCGFTQKVINAQEAGYDLVVIFDPYPIPFEHVFATKDNREIEITIQVVLISFMNGITIRDNYLFNTSYEFNYRVRIRPNIPDITYYMYLFGAVIGVCFFVMLLFMLCLLVKCVQERRRHRRNRLSSRQIKQIPTAKFNKGDQYDVCAICLEDYKEGEKLRLLPCSHAYHSKCIDPWLMNNRRNCPLCKRKITFGDSEDDSDSEDSELTSPAENTPLLITPVHRTQSWGTFAANPVHVSNNPDGSGPSSLPNNYQRVNQSFIPESDSASELSLAHSNQVVSLETETLLPPPQLSVNHVAPGNSRNVVAVHLNHGRPNDANDLNGHHGLIV